MLNNKRKCVIHEIMIIKTIPKKSRMSSFSRIRSIERALTCFLKTDLFYRNMRVKVLASPQQIKKQGKQIKIFLVRVTSFSSIKILTELNTFADQISSNSSRKTICDFFTVWIAKISINGVIWFRGDTFQLLYSLCIVFVGNKSTNDVDLVCDFQQVFCISKLEGVQNLPMFIL